MAPSKRKASNQQHAAATSPFKRLKAKVGKKAPKPANSTDTNFRSASIHIKNQERTLHVNTPHQQQEQQRQDALVLTSGRGRLLAELMGQMHHPTASIRMSAIKGIQNIVKKQTKTTTAHATTLATSLSTFLSAIGKASVDEEEDDVRQIGLDVFQELMEMSKNGIYIKPFVPLTLAFFKSALNSLDRDTRRDGLRYLHTLSRTVSLGLDAIIPIIPAIVRIWEDRAFQSSNTAATDKNNSHRHKGTTTTSRKKKNNQRKQTGNSASNNTSTTQVKNAKYALLDCMLSLLSGIPDEESQVSDLAMYNGAPARPTHTFVSGGSSKNSLFFVAPTKHEHKNLPSLHTLNDLPSFQILHDMNTMKRNNQHHLESIKPRSPVLELDSSSNLLFKFRDTLIDLQQNDDCPATFHLLAKVLDLFWQVFGNQLADQIAKLGGEGHNKDDDYGIRLVSEQIRTLLLESFPIKPSNQNTNAAMVDSINGQLSLTLVHMTHSMDLFAQPPPQNLSTNWLKPVVEYICNKLHDKSLGRLGNEASREAILQVLYQLLGSNHDIVHRVPRMETKLGQAFMASVIREHGTVYRSAARANAGLLSVNIIATIFDNLHYDLKQAHNMFGESIFQILVALPDFLVAFEGDYLESSATVIHILSQVFRRNNDLKKDDHRHETSMTATTARIRQSLERVVDPAAGVVVANQDGRKFAILEVYPDYLQRQLINLCATLEFPTQQTLTFMSQVCARSNLELCHPGQCLSRDVSSYLIYAMFAVRKTIPMQQFLSFLVDTTGATHPATSTTTTTTTTGENDKEDDLGLFEHRIVRFDKGVGDVGKCLVCCSVERIAPMLNPLMALFMKKDPCLNYTILQLRRRFAFSILALFALDVKARRTNGSILPVLSTSLLEEIPDAVLETLKRTGTSEDTGEVSTLVMAPIVALLFAEPKLLHGVFRVVLSSLSSIVGNSEDASQSKLLHWLIYVVQSPRLVVNSFSQDSIQEFIADAQKLAALASTSRTTLFSQLTAALETIHSQPGKSH